MVVMRNRGHSAFAALAVMAGFASWGICQSHMAGEVEAVPSHHSVHEGESGHGDGHEHEGTNEDPCCLTLSAVVKTVGSMVAAPEFAARVADLIPEMSAAGGADPAIRKLNMTLKPPGSLRPLEQTCTLLI